MPGLAEQLLRQLGAKMPTAPQVSPEQEQLYRQMAARVQEQRPQWKKTISAGVEGAGNFLKGLGLSDPVTDTPQSWPEFGGMVIGAGAVPFGPKGIKGLYSRVERIAENLPNSIHPNKLGTILRNRASQEEVQWRGLDKLMQGAGGKQIPKQSVIDTLMENPLDVKVTTKTKPYESRHNPGFDGSTATQYDGYQMPGASNYREDLIQLEPKTEIGKEQAEFFPKTGNQLFHGHHWEEPNVLVHVRHNERDIPPKPVYNAKVDKHTDVRWRGVTPAVGDRFFEGRITDGAGEHVASAIPRIPTGTPGAVPELKGASQDVIDQMMKQAPPSSRGRMLENVQSDWHQRGAHGGYIPPGQGAAIAEQRSQAIDEARIALEAKAHEAAEKLGIQNDLFPDDGVYELSLDDPAELARAVLQHPAWDERVTRYPTLTGGQNDFDRMRTELQQLRTQLDNAVDAAHRHANQGVPDAPFKDSWAELALKQQLLDIAHNKPDLEWLGIAPSSELRSRGEVISPEFQDVQLPNTLEKLLKPFGGKIEQVDLGFKPPSIPYMDSDRGAGIGPYGGLIYTGEGPGRGQAAVNYLPGGDRTIDAVAIMDQLRSQMPDVQAAIARLTPDMLTQIREKGFPLLTLLAMIDAERRQAQQGEQ